MKLYICSKFHEILMTVLSYRWDTILKFIFQRGIILQKKVAGFMVLILFTLSDAALYLYLVSSKYP